MAKYRFFRVFRKGKYSRKVEIRRERVEFDPGALFVCLAAAILVWLYVAGTHLQNSEQIPLVTEPAATEEVTADSSAEEPTADAGEGTEDSEDTDGETPVA